MARRYEDDFWYNTKISEIILFKLSYTVAKKMIFTYVVPFVKRVYPQISNVISICSHSSTASAKFIKTKRHIATHVKTVYEKVRVYVVSDADMCNDLIGSRMLDKNKINFIGLDCEWESSKKNGVALIQISCGNDCILYRTFKCNGIIPENLRRLLEDQHVLKFGVAIQEDVRRLHFHGVHVKGFVDLRNLAQRCLPPVPGNHLLPEEEDVCKWTSLRSLSANALELRLNKSYHVRCSNWEAPVLSQSQILYAAKDAIVSLEIFYALVLLRKVNRQSTTVLANSFQGGKETTNESMSLDVLLNIFFYCHKADQLVDMDTGSFDVNKPSDWLIDLARSLCQGIVDANHKCRPPMGYKSGRSQPLQTSSRRASTKAGKLKEYRHQCREKPMYENCFLIDPDENILATVNRQKASWYVHKNLGEIVKEEPFTVKLLFKPSGKPLPGADYYTTIKDNVCVVCESTESFVRKMIIPHDYRRYFPLELKDHMSHDVLLMCLDCHRSAQYYDQQIRQELAEKYNAPLGTKNQTMFIDNPLITQVKSAAKALYYNGAKIPEPRVNELKSVIRKYIGSEEVVTDEVIAKFAKTDIKIKNKSFAGQHGERVVNACVRENKLADFVRMWRQHFLMNMKPKHLPPMWSVEHNLDKLQAKSDNFVAKLTAQEEKASVGH